MDPPLEGNEFVVVSGVVVPFTGPETFIFGATEDGEAKSWTELPVSFQGAINHAEALRGAGYTVED